MAHTQLASALGHPFYERLKAVLDAEGFDRFVEELCAKFYAPQFDRPTLATDDRPCPSGTVRFMLKSSRSNKTVGYSPRRPRFMLSLSSKSSFQIIHKNLSLRTFCALQTCLAGSDCTVSIADHHSDPVAENRTQG